MNVYRDPENLRFEFLKVKAPKGFTAFIDCER